jgi:hypothetical protein
MNQVRYAMRGLALALSTQLVACAAAHRLDNRVTKALAGTCQGQCHREHRDSLYDENRCLDDCRAPE